jgi:peptidoglycan/xylan/chitin deacetylase (PgdA/CDA1 family)
MFWAGLLRASGVLYLAKTWVQRKGPIVLTFHRVLTDTELQHTASLAGMVVRGETFEAFLKYAAAECEFVDLSRAPDWRPSARLRLAVTFDDGWSDNATAACPIAQKYQTPLVIFIVPEKIGTELPFWPERAASVLQQRLASHQRGQDQSHSDIERAIEGLKELPAEERNQRMTQWSAAYNTSSSFPQVDKTMTWEQIEGLHHAGVTLGSHTRTHEILTAIPLPQAEVEIVTSRELIEQRLSAPCTLFSYPNGDCSEEVRELVQRAGYKLAFLNQDPGIWTEDCDPYLVPRVNICEHHLADAKGNFSALIFDYAVVWNAAKGQLAQMRTKFFRRLRSKWQSRFSRLSAPTGKKRLEKSS